MLNFDFRHSSDSRTGDPNNTAGEDMEIHPHRCRDTAESCQQAALRLRHKSVARD